MAKQNPYLQYLEAQRDANLPISAVRFAFEYEIEDIPKICRMISVQDIYDIFITPTYLPDTRIIDAIVQPLRQEASCGPLEKH